MYEVEAGNDVLYDDEGALTYEGGGGMSSSSWLLFTADEDDEFKYSTYDDGTMPSSPRIFLTWIQPSNALFNQILN